MSTSTSIDDPSIEKLRPYLKADEYSRSIQRWKRHPELLAWLDSL